MTSTKPHWLSRFGTTHHAWSLTQSPTETFFHRPLGLVETSFDTDGTYYGGRADMTATFRLRIAHRLSKQELRKRIILAWTALRLHHVLLMSRVQDFPATVSVEGDRRFVVDVLSSAEEAIKKVEAEIVWMDDVGYDTIDELELHHHALNVGRIVDPAKCLSKMHILPLKPLANGTFELRFLVIMGHQISDGLSAYNWFSHFIRILNSPIDAIKNDITASTNPESLRPRLPLAQEDLYPPIKGNKARQRWFWAIIRVLRHVQKTMPRTFTNPLRRETRLEKAISLSPKFGNVFDYTEHSRPPMSSGHINVTLSAAASKRLVSLCRAANVSIGAGCFALAGISMMKLHEARHGVPSEVEWPAFGASFPLNPRGFFGVKTEADSCMLAFSEGILMPFLPSYLPIEGRFRLVAKHANRELKVYQKRLKGGQGAVSMLDKHSPGRMLATGYLAQIERVDAKSPAERRWGIKPQGNLAPKVGEYGATCGVSSVGSMAAFFKPGVYDVESLGEKDLVVDYLGLKIGVRARENEFLVGSSTDSEGIVGFGVSYDLNAISQEAAEEWARTIGGLLERGDGARL